MIGLIRGLAYQAYKESGVPADGIPDYIYQPAVCDRRTAMQMPVVFMTSHRYYQLLDACKLRMRPCDEWLIIKRGYFYRPNRAGYTASVDEAGRYSEEEAKAEVALEPSIMMAIQLDVALRMRP